MIKKYLLFLLLTIIVFGCTKNSNPGTTPPVVKADTAALTSVKIETKHNAGITANITATVLPNDTITAVLPAIDAKKKLVFTFTTKSTGTKVTVNDTLQTSGVTLTDFSKPVSYKLTTPQGNTKVYTVIIKVFTGIPILYLSTAGPVVSKDDYVKGNVAVITNYEYPQEKLSISMKIKGRGNSTWTNFPKKPYRLKFDDKAAMLGMPAAKNWVLLANYDDKTLMRTRIAFELGRRLGADFTPDSRFVEVVMNGDYIGNYLLTSQVEVNENRVNITEMDANSTSPNDITGGYLLELDQRKDADFWFTTTKNLPFTIKSPEEITPAQLDYIHTYMQQTEDALYSKDWGDPVKGYAKYLNSDSFMKWFFVEEIVKNQDARDFSSMFYYKDRNGKLGMGPVWDFDISSGNCDYSVAKLPTDWYIRDATWLIRLAQDPTFILKVRKRWAEIKDKEVKQIFADIDKNAAYLQLSQQQNFKRWPILDKYVWPNAVVLGSYDKEVAYMKNFLTQRVNWIDANMASF